MQIVSLCTGAVGLDLAVEQVIPNARVILTSDIDKGASKVIAHRFPHAPNIGDFTRYDFTATRCDILTAGFPCQPVSHAGRRKGTADDRWLFDDILEAIGRMASRPRLLVFENVLGLLTANGGDAMARVVEGLAASGYVGRYRVLRASDVGAPHQRARVFIVAADARGETRVEWPGLRAEGSAGNGRGLVTRGDRAPSSLALLPTPQAADGSGSGRHNSPGHADTLPGTVRLMPTPRATDGTKGGPNQRGSSGDLMLPSAVTRLLPTPTAMDSRASGGGTPSDITLTDAAARRPDRWGQYAPAIERWERITRPAPAPTEPTGRGGAHRLSARFPEWMQGYPDGWITDTPDVTRNEALKIAGNSVCPQQGSAAIRWLLAGL